MLERLRQLAAAQMNAARAPQSPQPSLPIGERAEQDALRRNTKNLVDFPAFSFVKLVPVPIELWNEPYAFIDTGDRPEIVVSRPVFKYSIRERILTAGVGGMARYRNTNLSADQIPEKSNSNISVITVYDTYGLDIAYSYLRHLFLYKYDKQHPEWLALYLLGSLSVLTPKAIEGEVAVRPVDILYLCTRLIAELVSLENKQPKMLGTLQPSSQLTTDIIGKITGSERISKSVTAGARAVRCTEVPTWEELDAVTMEDGGPNALSNGNQFVLVYEVDTEDAVGESAWILSRAGDDFTLSFKDGTETPGHLDLDGYDLAQYPLETYEAVFQSRNCNARASVHGMLVDLKRRLVVVTEANVAEVSAWIVQLSYDTDEGEEGAFYGLVGLGRLFQRLVDAAILRYRD